MKKLVKQQSAEFPQLIRAASKVTRTKCDCVAFVHKLINNCLHCGKVVCEAQGEGPCFSCGNIVSRPHSKYIDSTNQQLFPNMSGDQRKQMEDERRRAIQHKDVLVDRDASKNMTQNIFDEQTDYYEISDNKWVSDQDRKFAVDRILHEQKKIIEEEQSNNVYYDHSKGEWVKVEFNYDDSSFKHEAKQFANQANIKPVQAKVNAAKIAGHADNRLRNNQKVEQIYVEIKAQIGEGKKGKNKKQTIEQRTYKGIDLVTDG